MSNFFFFTCLVEMTYFRYTEYRLDTAIWGVVFFLRHHHVENGLKNDAAKCRGEGRWVVIWEWVFVSMSRSCSLLTRPVSDNLGENNKGTSFH